MYRFRFSFAYMSFMQNVLIQIQYVISFVCRSREREKKKPSDFSRMFVVFAQQVPYLQLDKSPIAE